MSLSTQPDQPTSDQIRGILQSTLDNLHSQASSNKAAFNTSKTAGLGSAVLGVVACFGVPALGIPAAMFGAATYLAGLIGESATTDQVRVLPFCNIDLTGFAKMLTQAGEADSTDLEFAAYLPKRDRLLYLLILTQGEGLVHLLSKVPSRQWEPTIEALLNQTIRGLRKVGGDVSYQTLIQDGASILETEARELGVEIPTADRGSPQAVVQPQIIGNDTRQGAFDVPSQPFEIPVDSPESKLFDWNLLNTAYDDFPHLLLLGKTGAGKSYLAEKLGRFLDGSTIVITPKKKPKDFAGMQVIGVPYDFATIAANLEGLVTLVKQREDQMNRTGDDNFRPINVVLDEVPTFVAGCKDIGMDVVQSLKFIIRAGRTSKIRLILLAQGQEVKTLGIEGEGSLRDNLSYVYLKGFAEKHAQEIKLDISRHDRPCVIDGKVADISQLVALAPEPTPIQVTEHKPIATAQDLQRLYDLPTAQHEVEEEAIEISTSLGELKSAFPSWKAKSLEVASFVLDWMRKRPGEYNSAAQIRNVKRLRTDAALTNESIERLLRALLDKGLVTEDSGKFSAAIPQADSDDYDF
ncbi:hypothetical protein H6F89_25155 [Cyanobacteria bacterium FACHB-63]|nr:hypothetical protein [Cyanobacteria bacterium FACHB-63]